MLLNIKQALLLMNLTFKQKPFPNLQASFIAQHFWFFSQGMFAEQALNNFNDIMLNLHGFLPLMSLFVFIFSLVIMITKQQSQTVSHFFLPFSAFPNLCFAINSASTWKQQKNNVFMCYHYKPCKLTPESTIH